MSATTTQLLDILAHPVIPSHGLMIVMGLILVVVVVYWICRWWFSRDVYSIMAESWRVEVLDYEDFDEGPLPGLHRSQIVRRTVAHLRTELGLLADTSANRMVVSDVVRKFMKSHGMRPSHISGMFPIAVDIYFLRSTGDEELRNMRNSRGYLKYRRTTNNA